MAVKGGGPAPGRAHRRHSRAVEGSAPVPCPCVALGNAHHTSVPYPAPRPSAVQAKVQKEGAW